MPAAVELNPEEQERYRRGHRWGAAIKAGLLAGLIVLFVPSGNPWTAFARPSAAHIMGRSVTADQSVMLFSAEAIPVHLAHLAVGVLYALLLLLVIYRLHTWKAILAGVIGGLAFYGINFLMFRLFAPGLTGGTTEVNVLIAHVLFGGIAAGVIRGFLRPPQRLDNSQPNPGPRYP